MGRGRGRGMLAVHVVTDEGCERLIELVLVGRFRWLGCGCLWWAHWRIRGEEEGEECGAGEGGLKASSWRSWFAMEIPIWYLVSGVSYRGTRSWGNGVGRLMECPGIKFASTN